MLKPIPAKILTHSAILMKCKEIDRFQAPVFEEINLLNICIQPTHDTRLMRDNTEVALTSVAFVDAKLSQPVGFDFQAAQDESEANGCTLKLAYNGRLYTVKTIDALIDDTGEYHHTELGLL